MKKLFSLNEGLTIGMLFQPIWWRIFFCGIRAEITGTVHCFAVDDYFISVGTSKPVWLLWDLGYRVGRIGTCAGNPILIYEKDSPPK